MSRFPALSLLRLAPLAAASACFAAPQGITVTDLDGKVRVEINGRLFTEYHYTGARRPYLYPIIGPTGAGMTRNWPMAEVPGEERDHGHHKGLWYGHRHVNDVGFWEDAAGKSGKQVGRIVHDRFLELKGGNEVGTIRAKNNWVADNGALICTDERVVRVHNRQQDRMLDFDITITAGKEEVIFGDDKDGAMAIRVPESSRVDRAREKGQKKALPGEGHIVTSEGKRDVEAWGTRAKWCDYYGPVEGKIAGVAIFDHPTNPRHPTWWHVRTYGLFAANPFGVAQFEKNPDKKAGDFKISPGKSVTFRYRFYWHAGDEKAGKVAEGYAEYVRETAPRVSAGSR